MSSPYNRRMTRLLSYAADAMSNGCSPFDQSFLVKHAVTLDEVYTLGKIIGLVVRGLLRAPEATQTTLLICGAMPPGCTITPELIEASARDITAERVIQKLTEI